MTSEVSSECACALRGFISLVLTHHWRRRFGQIAQRGVGIRDSFGSECREWFRIGRIIGDDLFRSDEYNQLRLVLGAAPALEQIAQDWDIGQTRNFGERLCHAVVNEAGDGKALSGAKLDVGF